MDYSDQDKAATQTIIKTRIISIYGLPGEGKTFFATFLSMFYDRVYSNVDIYQNGKKKNITIKTIVDIEKLIKFAPDRGLLIIDEGGANANSRESMSEKNKIYGRLAMYCRKYNVNIAMISQLERMQDVYYREMSYYHFEMHSRYTGPNYLMFEAMIKDRHGNILANKEFDLIKTATKYKMSYNTLDKSLIE